MKQYRHAVLLLLLLVPSLACQAAMRLVSVPAVPLVVTSTATFPPAASPSPPAEEVSCPSEAAAILREANTEHLPLGRFPAVDNSLTVDIPLATYDIHGDGLSAPALPEVPPSLASYQRDFASQRSAWELFAALIPQDERSMLAQFRVITDGPGGVLSAVEQTSDDPARWILETDIADTADRKNLAFTLLHEYGHLLTLNSSQVPPDIHVFDNPNSPRARDRAAAACATYFPGEGCSLSGSYVNAFFGRFWKDVYDEWSLIDRIDDQDRRDARLHSFYRKYNDRFVDSYAATSPVEDIAETWAYFVLSPRPAGQSVSDQKMAFFYAFPELVTLRERVLAGLCAAKP